MLDNDRSIVAISESSSSAGLPIPAIHCLVIAVPEASSSAGSRVSAVGEGCSVTEALNASSGLTISARANSGWIWSVRSPTPCMTHSTLKISAIVASMQPVGIKDVGNYNVNACGVHFMACQGLTQFNQLGPSLGLKLETSIVLKLRHDQIRCWSQPFSARLKLVEHSLH